MKRIQKTSIFLLVAALLIASAPINVSARIGGGEEIPEDQIIGSHSSENETNWDKMTRDFQERVAENNEKLDLLKKKIEKIERAFGHDALEGEILVKFKKETRARRVALQGEKIEEALKRYEKNTEIEYAEPNYIARAFMVPNDPYYIYQWHLDNPAYGGIEAEEAWAKSDGNGVVVAIIDTGVAYENSGAYTKAPDLVNTCFVPGYDFINNDTHPNDDNSHGTHVAGTIAQSTNNSKGTAGVAFKSCIMPVKALDANGAGTYADIADAIRYAADHGAKVVNLSLGGDVPASDLEDALQYAYEKGVVIVAASGNENSNQVSYPAAYNAYVIAVGATRYNETRASYSNYGSNLDLMAPGGDTSIDQNGDGYVDGILQNTFNPNTKNPTSFGYWFFQGTSMAAPHVAGVAALLIAKGNATTTADVRTALESTAKDLGTSGWDGTFGWGRVNANAALSWQRPTSNSTSTNVLPIANAGPDQSAAVGALLNWNGSSSTDPDGTIVNYAWDFGDGATTTGSVVAHSYSTLGSYLVSLTVIDNNGATSTDTAVANISDPASTIDVFYDSFETSEWNGLWSEDSQNDWFRSGQRAIDGSSSAEVDGSASDAKLISIPVNLQGRTSAEVSFSWFIESGLDSNEYLAFDVSTNGGSSWVEKARLRGNVDIEDTWHSKTIELTGISSLRLRFRGKMSMSSEDANVDAVKVKAW